jgi:DNA replication protein DnaC
MIDRDVWIAGRLAAVEARMPAAYRGLKVEDPTVAAWADKILNRGGGATGGALLLFGPRGTGKTGNAWAVWPYLISRGFVGTWRATTEVDYLSDCINDKTQAAVAKTAKVLLLDDVGAYSPSDWSRAQLLALVDARWTATLPTIVTSNLTESQFAQHLGDRTTSRLANLGTFVTLTGADRRIA